MLYDFIALLEELTITYSWFQQDDTTANTANNSMKLLNEIFRECVITRNLWPLHSTKLIYQTFICGKQQNLQCIVIAHTHLTPFVGAQRLFEHTVYIWIGAISW
jgi:hypothetical protein